MKPKACLLSQLWQLLSPYLPPAHARLWVGYSGGLDSQLLLHLLAQAYQTQAQPGVSLPALAAIHVHHGLSPQADRWLQHCQAFCAAGSIPLSIHRVTPQQFSDQGPEGAARAARYQAFQSALAEQDVLVLGHHLDDQLETQLQRLCRGTGVLGLAGMPVYQANSWPFAIVRPWIGLGLDRSALMAQAGAMGCHWVEDESNQDTRFDRNFLRQEILPRLKSRWPKAALAAQRAALLCQEAVSSAQQRIQADKDQVQYVPKAFPAEGLSLQTQKSQQMERALSALSLGESLSVKRLLSLPSPRRRDTLRLWLQEKGCYSPSFDHLNRIEREILASRKGGRPRLKIRHYVVARWRDRLFIYKANAALVK